MLHAMQINPILHLTSFYVSYLNSKVCRFSFSPNTTAHPTEQFLAEMHFVDIVTKVLAIVRIFR